MALLSLLLALGLITSVKALSSVVQSYNASSAMQPGVVVQLSDSNSNTVLPLSRKNPEKMFGIVINPNDSPVTLSAGNNEQVFVATNGSFPVLVSNQAGAIKAGDYVTISSLNGIGMKATNEDPIVVGKATSSFNGTSDSVSSASLSGSNGHKTIVTLGRVIVNIDVAHNPLMAAPQNNIPGFLKKAGESLTNKPVSAARAYLSLTVLVICAVIAGSMLYAGVRSSIVSIGRNPLSKKSIVRGLAQVTLTSLIIFIAGLFAVYLILRI